MSKPIRLNITAEGKTELLFVKDVLFEYLLPHNIFCDVRSVLTSKQHKKRGGMTTYERTKADIIHWMKVERSPDTRFSTMFDYYALPKDFPGFTEAKRMNDPYKVIEQIESAFMEDISDRRFIPYIQLHEFESLIFSDLDSLLSEYEENGEQIEELKRQLAQVPDNNPELINDKRETSPSHRILKLIPSYHKVSTCPILDKSITIEQMREKCKHFNEWLTKLETLSKYPA